jgi:hypothetical protein
MERTQSKRKMVVIDFNHRTPTKDLVHGSNFTNQTSLCSRRSLRCYQSQTVWETFGKANCNRVEFNVVSPAA